MPPAAMQIKKSKRGQTNQDKKRKSPEQQAAVRQTEVESQQPGKQQRAENERRFE
jgi:hypothetical protein